MMERGISNIPSCEV